MKEAYKVLALIMIGLVVVFGILGLILGGVETFVLITLGIAGAFAAIFGAFGFAQFVAWFACRNDRYETVYFWRGGKLYQYERLITN